MNQLSKILLEMIRSDRREVRTLKGGLYLVYRPACHAKDDRCRLVAARFGIWPSEAELRTAREALQDAMDTLGNTIAYDVAVTWEQLPVKDDWAGHALYWRVGSSRDTMTGDLELARKLQAALHQRTRRLARQQATRPRVGAQTIRRGML